MRRPDRIVRSGKGGIPMEKVRLYSALRSVLFLAPVLVLLAGPARISAATECPPLETFGDLAASGWSWVNEDTSGYWIDSSGLHMRALPGSDCPLNNLLRRANTPNLPASVEVTVDLTNLTCGQAFFQLNSDGGWFYTAGMGIQTASPRSWWVGSAAARPCVLHNVGQPVIVSTPIVHLRIVQVQSDYDPSYVEMSTYVSTDAINWTFQGEWPVIGVLQYVGLRAYAAGSGTTWCPDTSSSSVVFTGFRQNADCVQASCSLPPVDFTYDPPADSATVAFQDNTPGSTAWLWDFGEGSTSAEQNPSFTFQVHTCEVKKFTVRHWAGVGQACQGPVSEEVVVRNTANPITPLTGFDLNLERDPVDEDDLTNDTRAALQCLRGAMGGVLTVSSAYRTPTYQRHLIEVWDAHRQSASGGRLEKPLRS